MSTATINGVEYVPAAEAPEPPPFQIVVTNERWNIAGRVTASEDGSLVITDAHVIRYWGTTGGLGELAADGPTSKTKLDRYGVVRVPAHAVVLTIDSEAALWPTK